MAVRRTLKQKQRAQVHRQENFSYSLSGVESEPPRPTSSQASVTTPKISQAEPSLSLKLFGYSPSLVYNDLLKTLIVTGIVVATLLIIFWWMR